MKRLQKLRTPKILLGIVLACTLAITPACHKNVPSPVPVGQVVKDSAQASIAKKNQEAVRSIALGNDIAKSVVSVGILTNDQVAPARAYMIKALQVSQTISKIQLENPTDWNAQIKDAVQGLQKIEPKFSSDPGYANLAVAVQIIGNTFKLVLSEVK